MKNKIDVLEAIKMGRKSRCIDSRDYARLVDYFSSTEWSLFGFQLDEEEKSFIIKTWSMENILASLQDDTAFGFEKALGQRGISASLMYDVVLMWLWILDDPLQYFDEYPQYGLPLFKAVACKYGFDNPIGENSGSEEKYAG